MHNFVRSDISIADSLNEVGSGLMSPQKKDFFDANRLILSELYADYNEKAANNKLQELRPVWVIEDSDDETTKNDKTTKRQLAYELYKSKLRFMNHHWERLKAINGGKTLYCPFCGFNKCVDMDHFVPRDVNRFPEYSAHLDNLIPLCHECNLKKSNKFLDHDERLFFNAYFDKLENNNILVGKVTLSSVDGLPQIEVRVNPELSKGNVPDKYILSTIKELELMTVFQDKANEWLNHEVIRISNRVRLPWEIIREEMAKLAILLNGGPDIVHPTVLKAIAESPSMEEWYNTLKNN